MTDLSGQNLGRYYLVEQLGEGGMAVVYKAYDTRLERDVAIKIIRSAAFPPEQLDQILKRFEREAKSLAKLSHPNIVKVHDFGEHEEEDVPGNQQHMIKLNAELAKKWPSITKRKAALPDAEEWKDRTGKLDQLIK